MGIQAVVRWWAQSVRDLHRLRDEPLLGVAVAAIFALLLLFILYPLARVLTVSLFPDGPFSPRLYREFLGHWFF
ncbi:MAG: hypothetical protein HYZ03_02630, partial [candidate division NC10 bacterium]|nr:hypothetical protein [candidate division NC10 bacterium]